QKATFRKRRILDNGPCARKSLPTASVYSSIGFLQAPPSRPGALWCDRTRRRRGLRIIFPRVLRFVWDRESRIEDRRSHRSPSSIFDPRSSLSMTFPARVALGDGDQDHRDQRNHQADGGDPAAHAVEIEKIKQRAERLGAGAVKKQGRAELAQKNRHENNPARH